MILGPGLKGLISFVGHLYIVTSNDKMVIIEMALEMRERREGGRVSRGTGCEMPGQLKADATPRSWIAKTLKKWTSVRFVVQK